MGCNSTDLKWKTIDLDNCCNDTNDMLVPVGNGILNPESDDIHSKVLYDDEIFKFIPMYCELL